MEQIELPIPVTKDRQGKLAKDYTLKDWMLKCHEEDMEFWNEALGMCNLDEKPSEGMLCTPEQVHALVEEFCDMLHVRFSMIHQFGVTQEMIIAGLHNSNVKARERGCIE